MAMAGWMAYTDRCQAAGPEGRLIRRYPGGNLTTSNVAFAGPAMDRLYVTGGEPGALFRIDLPGVRGLTILPRRRPASRGDDRTAAPDGK
jgi:sugar lactone lactonase YvrE